MMHYFNENAAAKYGVHAAILLQNIYYWCEKNKANGKHLHDGYFWTYNSEKAFAELFWYLSKWQIRNALKKLQEDGAIICGNFNQSHYDRTLWYAITEKGISVIKTDIRDCEESITKLQNCNMEIEKNQFQNCENTTPIPYINQDKNITDIKTDISVPKTRTRKTQPKNTYGEYSNVKLTDQEYERLVNDYGKQDTHDAIKFLDEFIEEKGYKSKSHNLALRRWVFGAVQERRAKLKNRNVSGDYDWGEIKRSLEHDT